MTQKGTLIVLSGFSGAGKGTVVKELLNRYDNYALSVSATTRKPREGEADGREYFFKSREEFLRMIEKNMLIEYAEYVNNYYGTPKEYVIKQLEAGKNIILEIEIQGALNIKEQFPDAILMFITPPDGRELEKRLYGRGTEDDATVRARLKRAYEEADYAGSYDYIVVNDDLNECVSTINSIIESEKYRASKKLSLIQNIKKDLERFN